MKVDAGDFDAWLKEILSSFRIGAGIEVLCGPCRGCCTAGRFVHLLPSDEQAFSAIPGALLHPAPGKPKGHAVMGYLDGGNCPMLRDGSCSIYSSRPSTCRTFDCRVLAATGLLIDGRWSERINNRVQAWQFSFPSQAGRQRHQAIKETAAFIQHHATAFPGGHAPSEPVTIAVLAIKVHAVLLSPRHPASPEEVANALVRKNRRFDNEAN